MRTEANLEQWKELYEITLNLKELKPWSYFWDTDLISITFPDADEPVYCSIMGRAGDCFGIGCYVGQAGLEDFDMIARSDELELPVDYIMFEQSNLSCYFGEREEVQPKQKKIISELGYKFRGKGNWLYFESFKKGYVPYIPDEEEVKLLINVYKNLIMSVRAVAEENLQVGFELGDCLHRVYDKKQDLWLNFGGPLPFAQKPYPLIRLENDLQRKKLKNRPFVDANLVMDLAYMNTYVDDEKYDRPVNPLLFVVMDATRGMAIATEMIMPDNREIDVIIDYFVDFIMQYGKMGKVVARNPLILSALVDTCEYLGVKVEVNGRELMMLDEFIDGLRRY